MDKIIVDTSVWVDYFKDTLQKGVFEFLVEALEEDRVVITDIIHYELLVGVFSEKDFNFLKSRLNALECLSNVSNHFLDFEIFAWNLTRKGLPGKYTDVSIAYLSQLHSYPILSFDHYFHKLAKTKIIETIPLKG